MGVFLPGQRPALDVPFMIAMRISRWEDQRQETGKAERLVPAGVIACHHCRIGGYWRSLDDPPLGCTPRQSLTTRLTSDTGRIMTAPGAEVPSGSRSGKPDAPIFAVTSIPHPVGETDA